MAGDVAEIVDVVGICVFCASLFLSTYTPNARDGKVLGPGPKDLVLGLGLQIFRS